MSLLLLLACSGTTPLSAADETVAACLVEGDRPAGWGEATHSNDADPDYDVAFDRSSVLEVTVAVAAEDLAAMYVELEELLGSAFGEGGGGGGQGGGPVEGMPDPEAAAEACLDLAEGDACTVDVDGVEVDGTCMGLGPGGEIGCVPEGVDPTGGGGGGADLDFIGADPSYVEATVTVGDDTWCHAGMRFKGNSTLSQAWSAGVEKLPFRLDFDRFEDTWPEVDDQRFHGFSDLSFGNNLGDATVVRDVMASVVLEDRGVPAARNRFAAVWLDAGEGPVYLGVYTMVEDPSDALLDRVWGDDDGDLYEGDGACGDLTCYEADSFEPKTDDDADGAQVQALVDALAADRTDAEAWRAGLEATVDVDAFLRWLAVNAAIENWDAYGVMAHNYYLYAVPADDGRLAWIPWDHNFSMMDAMMGEGDPLYDDVGEDWPLIRHVLDDEVYARAYLDALTTAMTGAWEEEAFEARAEAYRSLVEPYVLDERAESTFVGSEEAWDEAWDELYQHNADRRDEVGALLRE